MLIRREALFVVAAMIIAALETQATAQDEASVLGAIRGADGTTTLSELTALVRRAGACCRDSDLVATALTSWLHEAHPIHAGRLPTDAMQFRGFLLASLGAFGPSEDLFGYVRSFFLFADHSFNIAAAAVAARAFPTRGAELAPLMTPFLDSAYDDEPLDLTTPELSYPPVHRTSAKREIVRTLATFGANASSALPLLDAIADPLLRREAAEAAETIRNSVPVQTDMPRKGGLRVVNADERRAVTAPALRLVDQDGNTLSFADLRGRPFVLTFFYSRCPNATKCAATLHRLSLLGAECEKSLGDTVAVYGMTFDPFFDRPSILRTYGRMHGMKFRRNVRLLTITAGFNPVFVDQLQLRVSYGAGSVNLHGVQLFVFDKKARLSAVVDNDVWSTDDVKNALAKLAAE